MLKTFLIIDLIFIFIFSNFYNENKKEFQQVQEIIKLTSDFENKQNVDEVLKKLNALQNDQNFQELIKKININQEDLQVLINQNLKNQTIQELLKQIDKASLSTDN